MYKLASPPLVTISALTSQAKATPVNTTRTNAITMTTIIPNHHHLTPSPATRSTRTQTQTQTQIRTQTGTRRTPTPHTARTAAQPRAAGLHPARLEHVLHGNTRVRLLWFGLRPALRGADDADVGQAEDGGKEMGPLQPKQQQIGEKAEFKKSGSEKSSLDSAAGPEIDHMRMDSFSFCPGQWIDLHIPGVPVVGGFTITSAPHQAGVAAGAQLTDVNVNDADTVGEASNTPGHASFPGTARSNPSPTGEAKELPHPNPFPSPQASAYPRTSFDSGRSPGPGFELAVQLSPEGSPPAVWCWREPREIVGTEVRVRVGGEFVWPPPPVETLPAGKEGFQVVGVGDAAEQMPMPRIRKAVFVAGGVGINPLISMLSYINQLPPDSPEMPDEAVLFYSTRLVPSSLPSNPVTHTSSIHNPDGSIPDPDRDTDLNSILFLPRLRAIATNLAGSEGNIRTKPNTKPRFRLQLYITNFPANTPTSASGPGPQTSPNVRTNLDLHFPPNTATVYTRRLKFDEVLHEVQVSSADSTGSDHDHGDGKPKAGATQARTVTYVCGPPAMTDQFVDGLRGVDGVHPGDVCCEKWW